MTGPVAAGGARILRTSAEPGNLSQIRRFVAEQVTELGADPDAADDMVQAVDESVTNIIQHGYRGLHGMVEVEVAAVGPSLEVRLRDHAPPFDPTRVPAPDLDVPIERRALGGMGVHLTRELMDDVRYGTAPGWTNELTLVRAIGRTTPGR
jgi:serine/threonine-protein kinase RsbW